MVFSQYILGAFTYFCRYICKAIDLNRNCNFLRPRLSSRILYIKKIPASAKGQMISKALLVSSNSPKKRKNEFVFTTTTNSFVFWGGEFEDTKKSFRNHLTFTKTSCFTSYEIILASNMAINSGICKTIKNLFC